MEVADIGRLLIFAGLGLVLVGGLFMLGGHFPGFGQLPGDIVIHRDNVTVYIPFMSMILVSVILTIVLNVIGRVFR